MKNGNNRRLFAQIDELSYYGEESEVLFMFGSIFQLNEIYDNQLLPSVKLKSLLAQHPDIAMAYENTGLVYEDKVELEIGIDIYEEGSDNL
ncbi:unnamed protein product [Rotaria magnacalcarata]|uniref:Uncharacterized protein n=1 Tax=Rotaria magnacalcarata TaxID=392030 RepID=A0A8S2S3T6_9BILA|nr:unnamed protein product [Rotaria magnacalcarata]